MLRQMFVSAMAVDPSTNGSIVILKEVDGERTLPIWIGVLELTAIVSELRGIKFSRPMTHDLLKNIMELVDVKVSKIEIYDLKDSTYYASIYTDHDGREIPVDARPSDALAISLRVDAPIYVTDKVIERSKKFGLKAKSSNARDQEKKWQDILENLGPEAFGKYKM